MSSLYGIDLINEIIIDLHQYNSNVLKSNNDEFKQIVTCYANFFYSAYNFYNKKIANLLLKKIKFICEKVTQTKDIFLN